MEHRWGERVTVDVAVRLATRPFGVRAGRLENLSLSGARISAPVDLRPLSRVQVALVLPRRFTHATPVISAYVTRRTADSIGVEWCEFAPRAVVDLLRSAGIHRSGRRRAAPPDRGDPPGDQPASLPRITSA